MEDTSPKLSPARAAADRPKTGRLPGSFSTRGAALIGTVPARLPERLRTDGWWLDQPCGWLTRRLDALDSAQG